MTFYVNLGGRGGKRGKPKPRDPVGERLQKMENATFVSNGLGRFSKSLNGEFSRRAKAGGARSAGFSADIKQLGLDMIDETLAGIEMLPNGRPRIDEAGRSAFRERARGVLDVQVSESNKAQARQVEHDALDSLLAAGAELNEVASRRPNDFAVVRDNLGRAVGGFSGVFGAEREASIRLELDDDLFVAKLRGMAPGDLDGALAELNDPANLPGHSAEERADLAEWLRMKATASRAAPGLDEAARRAGERRTRMAERARLDAAESAAHSAGSMEALKGLRAALTDAVERDVIEQTRFNAVLARLEDREAALIAQGERIERIDDLLAGGKRPDTSSKDDRLAVDEHYGVYRQALADLSEPERIAAEAAYVGRVGILPTPLAREIEGGLLRKDPEAQIAAARRFTLIDGQLPAPCPEGVFTLVPCERARKLVEFDAMGLEPARAVELTDLVFRPGENDGEMRTLKFKRGEEEARESLLATDSPARRRGPDGSGEGEQGDAPETLAGAGGNDTLVGGEGRDDAASNDVSEWAIPDMPPPTDERVDFYEWRDRLNFDPEGPGDVRNFWNSPLNARTANSLGDEADQITKEQFAGQDMENSPADAFRHALWSYTMTTEFGPEIAKTFGDSHEAGPLQNSFFDPSGDPNEPGVQIMDLYNNNVGRLLALDPANANRNPVEVVREALGSGMLQTSPLKTK